MAILCEPDSERAAQLSNLLGDPVQVVNTLADAAMALAAGAPRTVVVGPDASLEAVESFAARLRAEHPDAVVVLLRGVVDDEIAQRAGVAGLIAVPWPGDPATLAAALPSMRSNNEADERRLRADVITVFSPKGGCGTTTVATNLAVALGRGSRSVCLVDLDLAFGDVAIALNLTPQHTILDGVGAGGSIAGQLDQIVTPYRPNLDCVLAPVGPADGEKVPASLVAELLDALRCRYDSVVVDTSSQLSEHALFALDASRFHVLVTAPEIAAVKNMRLTIDMFDVLSYRAGDRLLVLNEHGARGSLAAAEVSASLGTAIDAIVPHSSDVSASLNSGVPLTVSEPKHDVSRALSALADRLHGDVPSTRPRRSSLRLRKRSA